MQITGHKNVASINNYSILSGKKQKQISGVLSGATAVQTASKPGKSYSVSIARTISTLDQLVIYRVRDWVCWQMCQQEAFFKIAQLELSIFIQVRTDRTTMSTDLQ